MRLRGRNAPEPGAGAEKFASLGAPGTSKATQALQIAPLAGERSLAGGKYGTRIATRIVLSANEPCDEAV